MRIIVLTTAILIAGVWTDRAAADPYRWCATDVGESGGTSCYFVTLEQCKATVSGAGMLCTPNPFYTGPATEPAQRAPKKKKPS